MTHLVEIWISDTGRGLSEAFFMFWETLWALALGLALAGVIRVFVPTQVVQRRLGDHRPAAIARASGYGMVSSSCSYAATAMARSLFSQGADFVAALVFMVASTNLVVELGAMMLILLGWRFVVGEFIGGPVMIVLISLLGSFFLLRGTLVERARIRVGSARSDTGCDHDPVAAVTGESESRAWPKKFTSKAAWADAAGYIVAELTMLRRELVIGFTVAGFLAILVPVGWWNSLFWRGHGFWTTLENAFVGPVIALVSWVCSIGNVPLAAALWKGGIGFGGVIGFLFADLIAMPLVLIYRKYYGRALAVRMVALLYVAIVAAALAVQALFEVANAVPHRGLGHPLVTSHISFDYTTYLNFVAIVAMLVLYWLYRNRARFGGEANLVRDPICGMQIRADTAPAQSEDEGRVFHFCSERCRDRFEVQRALSSKHESAPSVSRSTWILPESEAEDFGEREAYANRNVSAR